MIRTFAMFGAAILLGACSNAPQQVSLHETLPDTFQVSVGGFLGGSYSVRIEGDHLLYTEVKSGLAHKHSRRIRPTAEEWQAFWKEAEALDLWRWRSSYNLWEGQGIGDGSHSIATQSISDGTQWRVEISYRNHHVMSDGDNAYPSDKDAHDTVPSVGGYSARFRKFNELVRRLIHGLPYH